MSDILRKIRSSADRLIEFERGGGGARGLPRLHEFLNTEGHRLRIYHRGGASGGKVCAARAFMIDLLMRAVWDACVLEGHGEAGDASELVSLVGLGGYGRCELNPLSDIDLMFLYDTADDVEGGHREGEGLRDRVTSLLYPLWDLGLKVGHAFRDINDCIEIAEADIKTKTALLESRLIAGSEVLFNRFRARFKESCVAGKEQEYLEARLKDQTARRGRHGNSYCLLEPNIKNGCGGLRDFQNLRWMLYFKYHTSSIDELIERGYLGASDLKLLESAYDFLLRLRTELHYQAGRPTDILHKSYQAATAYYLGFVETSHIKRIEDFMGVVYKHLRNVFLISRDVENRLISSGMNGAVPGARSGESGESEFDGFVVAQDRLAYMHPEIFKEDPARLMRVFLYLQKRGISLGHELARLVRDNSSLINMEFRNNVHVRKTFLEILGQRGNVGRILRLMHELGVLGRFIPEFGRLTCLVQHDFYHRYTVDEHTLVCLEELDRVWTAQSPPLNKYAEVLENIDKPYILYLALLLHDAGKAIRGKHHEERSAAIAGRTARRLGLSGADVRKLLFLVGNHLIMANISQRRDLDDPSVIRQFTDHVKSAEQLALLMLHTFTDSKATGSGLWNDFKDTLLWTLYHRSMAMLSGDAGYLRGEEKQKEKTATLVKRMIPEEITGEELKAHFDLMPVRYFRIFDPQQISVHVDMIHEFMKRQLTADNRALEPVIRWQPEPDRGYTVVHICTWDRPGLFSKITGALTAAELSVLGAVIFTRADAIVIDSFMVIDAQTGYLPFERERDKFDESFLKVMAGEIDLDQVVLSRAMGQRPPYRHLQSEPIPTEVFIDNQSAGDRTIIEIQTEDRLGLLYAVSRALSELELDISVAKICTEKGAAIDAFYLRELNGGKVTDSDRLQVLKTTIRLTLDSLRLG